MHWIKPTIIPVKIQTQVTGVPTDPVPIQRLPTGHNTAYTFGVRFAEPGNRPPFYQQLPPAGYVGTHQSTTAPVTTKTISTQLPRIVKGQRGFQQSRG